MFFPGDSKLCHPTVQTNQWSPIVNNPCTCTWFIETHSYHKLRNTCLLLKNYRIWRFFFYFNTGNWLRETRRPTSSSQDPILSCCSTEAPFTLTHSSDLTKIRIWCLHLLKRKGVLRLILFYLISYVSVNVSPQWVVVFHFDFFKKLFNVTNAICIR